MPPVFFPGGPEEGKEKRLEGRQREELRHRLAEMGVQ